MSNLSYMLLLYNSYRVIYNYYKINRALSCLVLYTLYNYYINIILLCSSCRCEHVLLDKCIYNIATTYMTSIIRESFNYYYYGILLTKYIIL